jgi:hypothetical protein
MSVEGKTWRGLLGNRDVAALAANTRGDDPFRVATAGAYHLLHPQYWMPHDLEMADGYLVMYPERYQKFWNRVVEPLVTTQPELEGHFTRWGSRVYLFHSRLPEDAEIPVIPFDAWYNRRLLGLANTRFVISRKPMDAPGMRLLPPAVSDAEREAWAARGAVAKMLGYARNENPGRRYFIYENPEAVPRAYGVRSVSVHATPEECLAALAAADAATLRSTAFVAASETDAAALPAEGDGQAIVKWLSYRPDRADIDVTVRQETVLILSMLYYDRWRATADGQSLRLFPANGPFMGLVLPAGTRRVTLAYNDPRPGKGSP